MSDIDAIEEFWPGERRTGPYSDWRRYRIEYGGHAQNCVMEGIVYLPPGADVEGLVSLILGFEERDRQFGRIKCK